MTGPLSSARIRRRLVWGGVFLAVAGLVGLLFVLFPEPKKSADEQITTIPGDVVVPDRNVSFVKRAPVVLPIAETFVRTAVARKHVEKSWDIVTADMKSGFTKKSWSDGGAIPVVPFPVKDARWKVYYSFQKEIDLRVALFAPKKSKVCPVVFDLVLNRGEQPTPRTWLVSSFLPAPAIGGDYGHCSSGTRDTKTGAGSDFTSGSSGNLFGPSLAPDQRLAHSSTFWLLLPASILSLLVVVFAGVLIKGRRERRIYDEHILERQSSSE